MKTRILNVLKVAILLMISNLSLAQAPTMGTAADFVIFTTVGAIGNTGISHLTGNVGTNNGGVAGFGNVNGVMTYTSDLKSAQAATDLLIAYNQLNATVPTFFPAPLLGNGDTLIAGVYSITGATTLNLNLTLDAAGNSNAVFIFQIQGPFSTNANSKIKLINGAKACNVFWKVEGLVEMASGTSMKGTVIANNAAINMNSGDTLEGRVLSTAGAITVNGVLAYTPIGCGSPYLTGPLAPSLVSAACYAIFSSDGPVTNAGITHVTGDVGTNVGLTLGFNPLFVTGDIHAIPDGSTAAAAADLLNAYSYLNILPSDIELLYPAQFGNQLVLTPHTYIMNGATTFTDTVFLDAQGNTNAVFVIKIYGFLSTSTYSKVKMINGTQSKNVFWLVSGAVSINDYSEFVGTIVCNNGAINLNTGVVLDGRALTTTGALSASAITAIMPAGCAPSFVTNTWLGSSNDWTSIQNWSLGIEPQVNHNVIIPAVPVTGNNFPIIATAAVCHDISIASGAQLINNSTLAINGTVKVEQYLSANQWHFISSPINNASAYAFSLQNPNNVGDTMYLQKYNEAWVNLPLTSPWIDITSGWAEQMIAAKGYEVWSDVYHTITLEGTQLNSAPVNAPVMFTSAASTPGFNLIGNPYPSAINILGFSAWGTNMDASMWVWNNANYLSTNGIVGDFSSVANNQAFMVKANAAGATFMIPSTSKTFGGVFMKATIADLLKLQVNGNNYSDAAYINFNSNATNGYDGQYDVEKMFGINAAPQFYSIIANKNLSINTLPSLSGNLVIPMGLNVGVNGTYTINASEMNSFANGTTIILEDTKTNTYTNLMQQSVYTFTADPADNVNRFNIHFGVNGINENNSGNINIYSDNNVIYVNNTGKDQVKEIVVMNVLGQQLLSKQAENTTLNKISMNVASAYYIVKVVTVNKVYTEKVYVK